MDADGARQQERDFLRAQLVETQHKTARLENVRSGCHDCPEASGLDALLSAAAAERRLIEDLIAHAESDPPSLALSAAMMARFHRLDSARSRLATRWRRGRPTPPAYWEIANERTFLEQLLRRWNAWQAGRLYYPNAANGMARRGVTPARQASAPARANPWETPSALPVSAGEDPGEDPEKLLARNETRRAEQLAALERAGVAPDHVEIIFASDQIVFLIAYAHDERERRAMINTLLGAGYVETLMADIRVNDPAHCPVCQARETARRAPLANEDSPPGR